MLCLVGGGVILEQSSRCALESSLRNLLSLPYYDNMKFSLLLPLPVLGNLKSLRMLLRQDGY